MCFRCFTVECFRNHVIAELCYRSSTTRIVKDHGQYVDGFCIAFRCEIAIYNMKKYGIRGLNIIKIRFNCKKFAVWLLCVNW